MANKSTELDIFRGDTKKISVTVTDDKRSPVDLTGATVWMTAKRKEKDPDSKAVFQLNSPDNGIVIEPAEIKTPGVKASAVFEGVTYTAVDVGTSWNGLYITFEGNNSIIEAVDSFNATHPSNLITHDAENGEVYPLEGSFPLENGVDTIYEPQNGKCLITINPVDTADDKFEAVFYDIQVKLSNGEIHTVCTGKLNIRADITQTDGSQV